MRCYILILLALLTSCVSAPRVSAVTVPFSSPPFTFQFIVNQPGNSIDIRFPGITNISYIPGTSAYISNQQAYLGTNNFSGGGGGGGTVTFTAYTNGGPDTVLAGTIIWLNTNKFAAPVDSRAWTNLNNGVSRFAGTLQMRQITSDGGGFTTDGSGDAVAGTLRAITTLSAGGGGFLVDSSGNATGTSFTGNGPGLQSLNATHVTTGTLSGDRVAIDGVTIVDSSGILTAPGAGGGTITALTQDVLASGSGSVAATVVGINGTLLSGLSSGLLYLTTGTGVPSTKSTWPNVAAVLTGLIPQSALGTGSGGTGTKFLADDQTYKTPSGGSGGITNLVMTNSLQPFVAGPGNSIGYVPSYYTPGVLFPGYFRVYNGGSGMSGMRYAGMTLGDLNGDGQPDVVGSRSGAISTFAVTTNGGNGQFPTATSYNLPNSSGTIGHPVLEDVDGNGSLDVILAQGTGGSNAVFVFANNGTATAFTQLGSTYTIGTGSSDIVYDLAGGKLDSGNSQDFAFISRNLVGAYTNDGTGLFALSWSTGITIASTVLNQQISIADFDGDGTNDILIVESTGGVANVKIYTNAGLGQFALYYTKNIIPTTDNHPGVTVADVNGDGRPDYIVSAGQSTSHTIYTYTNTGVLATGFAASCTNVLAADTISSLSAGDFNMDGKPDLVVDQDTIFSVIGLTNNSAGGFVFFETNNLIANGSVVEGDFNGDGRPDLLFGAFNNAGITLNNMVSVLGAFQGDFGANSNLLSLATASSSSYAPGSFSSGISTPAVLTLNTNSVPYVAAFAKVAVIGDAGGITNVSFCTTSAATSGTVTSANTHQIETTYMSSGSTIVTLTWALPTTTTLGKIFYLHSKSAITTLTVTGTSFIDPAVTTMIAGQTIGFETIDGSGNYIRMQ